IAIPPCSARSTPDPSMVPSPKPSWPAECCCEQKVHATVQSDNLPRDLDLRCRSMIASAGRRHLKRRGLAAVDKAVDLPWLGSHEWLSPRRSLRQGAVVLEFAIIAPVIFLVVLGIIELCRGLMVSHLLTSAARQGCRIGVIEGKSNSDITTAVNGAL